jgi:hypothetical protein
MDTASQPLTYVLTLLNSSGVSFFSHAVLLSELQTFIQ